MEDKGKGLVGEDEENSLSVSEGGPSNMEVDGSDDNYDDDEDDDDDEGDESDEAVSVIPTTFERLEYEALAEKKRKALFDSQRDGSEKRGKYDAKELVFTGRRRRRRMNKKRGRRQGSKKQISPEIQKRMTEAIFLHADNKDSEAFPILFDIINEAPAFGQAYYYLALVPDNLGKTEALSTDALKAAAYIKGPKSHVWKLLYDRAKEQGNMVLASDYVSKAVQADPEDIDLKYEYADLCLSAGKYKEAAETYEKIFRRHPDIIEPLKRGTEYFLKSGKGERAANMLEDHIKSHPSEVGPDILDLLADVLMQINAYDRALKYIHDVRQIYNLGKELPSSLKIRQAICHVRLEEMEQAEIVLNILPREAVSEHPKLIIDLADELTNIENFHSALKYYLLAINDTLNVSKSIRQLYSIVSSLTTFASSLW
ncbi:uncharacterized protein LOC125575445 [Brassica napus]|uniref:uncharacterized protein LOC125575445 n=1 Tax=Brassica napus TaxID=3708 RepID=UPI00207AFE18|nr:uncharacterized protein LOC125575445 [Brassica napus]